MGQIGFVSDLFCRDTSSQGGIEIFAVATGYWSKVVFVVSVGVAFGYNGDVIVGVVVGVGDTGIDVVGVDNFGLVVVGVVGFALGCVGVVGGVWCPCCWCCCWCWWNCKKIEVLKKCDMVWLSDWVKSD